MHSPNVKPYNTKEYLDSCPMGYINVSIMVIFLYIPILLVIPPLSGTGEGRVPRCRRRCSPVGNDPFPGAGQNPRSEGVLDGVEEMVSEPF